MRVSAITSIQTRLASPVATGGTFDIPYPAGQTQNTLAGSTEGQLSLASGGAVPQGEGPGQVEFSFGASSIAVTNRSGLTLSGLVYLSFGEVTINGSYHLTTPKKVQKWIDGVDGGQIPDPSVAPTFGSGGTITVDGNDIVFTAPTVTAGTPTPTVTLAATRNGTPITVTDGRYAGGAVPGDADRVYAATWTAANGVPPNATRQANLTVTPTAPTIASVDYFARDIVTHPWYYASVPNAVYDATGNKTWVAYERWDGRERRAALRIYDHATSEWSQTYDLFASTAPDDDHGVPTLCFDHQGHVHVFGGGHSSGLLWWSTTAPRDPATFVRRGIIGGDFTDGYGYPHPIAHGTTIFLFMRDNTGTGMPLVLRKITSLSNGNGTVGGEFTVAQRADTRCYIGWPVRNGSNKVILPIYGSNTEDTARRDVWFLDYDLQSGAVSNISGTVTTPQASLPITLGADHRVLDQTAQGTFGGFGFAERDAAGRLHLIYQQGDTAAGTRTLYQIVRSGGTWSEPVLVGTLGNRYNGLGMRAMADGSMRLLYAKGLATERDGDIYQRDWTQAGGWTGETRIRAADTYRLGVPNPVFNGTDELHFVFGETSISGSGGAALNDTSLGKILKAYAYGTGGLVAAQGVEPSIANAQVNGTPVVGRVLSADTDVRGEPQPALAYQWRRAGAAISGATARTYTAVSGDIGAAITCEITATSVNGSATVIATGQTIHADLTSIDASQIAGPALLFNADASETASITLTGSDVTGWQDQSPAGFALSVAASSTAPAYSATGWDGTRPAVTFDGAVSGDMLRADGPLHSYLTVYMVAERIAGLNDVSSYGGLRPMMAIQAAPRDATTVRRSVKVMPSIIRPGADAAQSTFQVNAPNGSQAVTSGFTVGKKAILRTRVRPTYGTLFDVRVDGGTVAVGNGMNSGSGEALDNALYLGGDPNNIGRRASFKLAELVLVYGTPTAEQDADIRAVLSAKWGLP
ncbi:MULTISPECIES: BNR-4 repeat-containing protein [Paracoccus]|uniref:BNR-4 repeat-containing protein n=1 Tax=Paracoccus TaxID=265 RepID=UPI00086AC28C|nr:MULTISPECIES: BNR-4 repeat-containing protein [Paracoccus]ODT60969.1 MAG: hypothetical protein ABS73_03790 [Paracoccus sp. SCN 68-21]